MTSLARRARRGNPVAVVKCGSAAVPIYRGVVRGRIRLTVAHYLNGQRRRQSFGSLDAAKEEARIAALNIQRGRSDDNDLRSQDREAFHVANHMPLEFGVPLIAAVEEYARCRRKLGDRPLTAAIDEFQRCMCGFTAGVLVPNVVAEMILAKKQDDLSERTLATLRSVLGRFKLNFPGEIAFMTSSEINAFLIGSNSPRLRGWQRALASPGLTMLCGIPTSATELPWFKTPRRLPLRRGIRR